MVVCVYNSTARKAETQGFLQLTGQPVWPNQGTLGSVKERHCCREQDGRSGETALQLGACTALPEDVSLVSIACGGWLTNT